MFHMLFGLIGLAINLIVLPFRLALTLLFALLSLFFSLFGITLSASSHIIAIPLVILRKNLFWVGLIVLSLVIYFYFKHDSEPRQQSAPAIGTIPSELQPAQGTPQQTKSTSGQILVEAVRKREDGNSAFAADLYTMMNDEQRAYYSQFFFWAMTNLQDGQTHPWANGNTNGSFTLTSTFRNSSGTTCRRFHETLKVRSIEQNLDGIGCIKSNGSWCKLKANATPACGLGGNRGFWDSLKDMF